jgi:hypothetical protein
MPAAMLPSSEMRIDGVCASLEVGGVPWRGRRCSREVERPTECAAAVRCVPSRRRAEDPGKGRTIL